MPFGENYLVYVYQQVWGPCKVLLFKHATCKGTPLVHSSINIFLSPLQVLKVSQFSFYFHWYFSFRGLSLMKKAYREDTV